MTQGKEKLITAIDIGSAKVTALVAEVVENGLRYRAHGTVESRGSRKGVIVEIEKAARAIQQAVDRAEMVAGTSIGSAIITVGGTHIKGITSRSGVILGGRPREITRDDIKQALDKARAVSLPPDRQVMHLLPQEFILDDQGGIRDPLGMTAAKLEAQIHLITATSNVCQTAVTAANKAGIEVLDTVYEGLVASDVVAKSDERELGICVVDIGAGTTELIVLFEGSVAYSSVIPIGGDHFTNDLAVGLRTPLSEAEKLKRTFGAAVVTRVPEGIEVEVPAVGDRPSRLIPQRFVAEILEPRATELFEFIRENLRGGGVFDLCAAGTVLTGGGARLPWMAEIAENVTRKPSRVGVPTAISKLPAELAEPEYAVAIGALLYAHRTQMAKNRPEQGFGAKIRGFFAKAAL